MSRAAYQKDVLAKLQVALQFAPSLRIGQLISNLVYGVDVFYASDELLAKKLDDFILAETNKASITAS